MSVHNQNIQPKKELTPAVSQLISPTADTSVRQETPKAKKEDSTKLTNSFSQSSIQPINYDINRKCNQPKYPKIQPAIAIKPKPIPITVLPKPVNQQRTHSATFNPNSNISPSQPGISLNINTSKKWVLPPRPRPGRKPTHINTEEDNVISSSNNNNINKTSPKKKIKVVAGSKKEDSYDGNDSRKQIISQLHQQFPNNGKVKKMDEYSFTSTPSKKPDSGPAMPSSASNTSTPIKLQHASPPPPPPPVIKDEESSDMIELKITYLSKLKEQELIRNYIEVLNNQIKELRFVQNGVITFDALTSDKIEPQPVKQLSTVKKPPTYEQLENINNLNDLNNFLAYLTKSSSIIHSVTKKFLDNDNNGNKNNLNEQIKHYSEIRSKYKLINEENKKLDKINEENKSFMNNNIGLGSSLSHKLSSANTVAYKISPTSMLSSATPVTNTSSPSSFTPNLLKPLKSSNLFESDDELIDLLNQNELHQDDEFLNNDNNLSDKLLLKDANYILNEPNILTSSPTNVIANNTINNLLPDNPTKIHTRSSIKQIKPQPVNNVKKKSKINCGFCSNDTPCLCLDTEIEINQIKKK